MLPELARDFLPYLPTGFRYGMRFIWMPEQDGHQNDSAPGETFRTSWGIIQTTWDGAVAKGIVKGDLANATQTQAGNIYLSEYWNAMRLSMLPTAIGFVLFCDATLTGPGHVAALVQRIVGMTGANIDGVIGDKTLDAINSFLDAYGQAKLVDQFIDADEVYLASLANAPKFINGWTRREEDEQAIAHEIIKAEGVVETTIPVVAVPAPVKVAAPAPVRVPMLTVGRWLVTVERA